MNETESQWDKLLKIKTTGRDDSTRISTAIPTNRHPIPC